MKTNLLIRHYIFRIDTGFEDELGWDQDSGWDKPQYPTLQSQDLYGNNLVYNPNPNYANIASTPRSGGGYSPGSTLAPAGINRRPYPDNKACSYLLFLNFLFESLCLVKKIWNMFI